MMNWIGKLAAAAALWTVAGAATAATIVDTGEGSLPGVTVAPTTGTYGAFTITEETVITGIEFFGSVLQGGNFTFNLSTDGGNQPGFFIISQQTGLAAGDPAWRGISGLSLTLFPNTYWVGFFNGGTGSAVHYGGAPNGLGNEALFGPLGYTDADPLQLAWRISGTTAASEPLPAVPEPASWLMLILGFGFIGFALRSKRFGAARLPVAA